MHDGATTVANDLGFWLFFALVFGGIAFAWLVEWAIRKGVTEWFKNRR